jgi:hypothetical protein
MERQIEHKRHSGSFWAYFLIIVGILWLMSKGGWDINLPGIGDFFAAIGNFFGKMAHLFADATLPILVIIAGLVLIAGRKIFGALLLALLILIIVPQFLIIPGIILFLFFPILLIIIGIVILSKLF